MLCSSLALFSCLRLLRLLLAPALHLEYETLGPGRWEHAVTLAESHKGQQYM